MSSTSLPREVIPVFKVISELSDETWKKIMDSLTSAQSETSIEDISKSLQPLLPKEVPTGFAGSLVSIIISFRSAVEATGRSAVSVIDSLITSLKNHPELSKQLAGTQAKLLTNRLAELLKNNNSLSSLAHARRLVLDNPCIFTSARILTDIRPVFGDSVEEPPVAFTIIHTLKVAYTENDEHQELFLSLDEDDLRLLKSLVVRAESKSSTVAKSIAPTGIKIISITGENRGD